MFNFQTATAQNLHSIFLGIVSQDVKLKSAFDVFLELMIHSCCDNSLANNGELLNTSCKFTAGLRRSPALLSAMDICKQGMIREQADVLGDYFEHAGFGDKSKGQTLTPQALADYIVRETIMPGQKDLKLNICDPCCGTGRFLLAAGRYATNATLYGVDIDPHMAVMSAVNLAVFQLRGLVVCANVFDFEPGELDFLDFECAYEVGHVKMGKLRIVHMPDRRKRKQSARKS